MHIEGVASRRTRGPAGAGQRFPTHHCAEAVEQRFQQTGLHGRERYPVRTAAQHAVGIEHGSLGHMTGRPMGDGGAAGIDVALAGREPDPVLEAVDEEGGCLVGVDQEQARASLRSQCCAAISFERPMQEGDIHGRQPTDRLFRHCFVDVKP